MASCFEVEEEADKEDNREGNSSEETNKTVAAFKAMLMRLNWGQIFILSDETRQHMVTAIKHPELIANKVSWATLKENGVLLESKMTKAPLLGVATYSKGLL